MFDGIIALFVMPIYIVGLIFIFIFNLLCKIFAFREHELSSERFCFFVDYNKYILALFVLAFLIINFW